MTTDVWNLQHVLKRIVDGHDLTSDEATHTMSALISGGATQAQIGALLTALRTKGETVTEVAAFAATMRANLIPVPAVKRPLLDTCGTGGSARRVFNVSTATAFVAASAGISVAKHGNRAMSGVCGSADVLEALGVRIDLSPEQCAACIDEVGVGFLFAPAHHPATRHVSAARREIGIRTVFNLLGPLSNPAGATMQLMGVYDPSLCALAAGALKELGSESALVVHGEIGLGEVSTIGHTIVSELRGSIVSCHKYSPADLGLTGPEPAISDLAPAGSAHDNALLLRGVLSGSGLSLAQRARRDLVAVNAAAALRVACKADSWADALSLAQEIISTGIALNKLDELAAYTQIFH